MLEGLDPNQPETWNAALEDLGLEDFQDDFYENVFPDLDPGSQEILSQVGSKDGRITLEGFGKDYTNDPFAAFAGITRLTGDDSDIYGGVDKEEEEEEKDVADSFRIFADDDDDEDESIFGTYKKTKSGQNILDDYKKGLGFDSFF